MYNRIKKLLRSEYKDLSNVIFIESSFAEVDSKGNGIRQTQLGLTKSHFIIGTDRLPSGDFSLKRCHVPCDPEIECFEIVNVIPLDLCQFQICARLQRNFIKITFENGRKMFFEFGGHLRRGFFYNLWADRIFILNNYKSISYSTTTTTDSVTSVDTPDYVHKGDGDGNDLKFIHKNSNFNMESSEFGFVNTSPNIDNFDAKTQKEVLSLKRRVHKLNHNIRKQLEFMMNGESPEESTHLLMENEKELEKVHSVTGDTSHKKKVIDIYKKPSSRPSSNSIQNIWF